MKKFLFVAVLLWCANILNAQLAEEEIKEITIDGKVVKVLLTEEGDTILLADLKDISVTALKFNNYKERRHYSRLKYNAVKVYPYGVEAIKLFREIEEETKDMKHRKRKKYIKAKHKELKETFEEPLRKLTKTQGHILIKMIERELDKSVYDLVKDLRGGFTAGYWNNFSRMFGYDIKQGYDAERDIILEAILSDLDISHQLSGE